MQFSDVAPGAIREAESASWHNAVNALLRRQESPGEEAVFSPAGVITFCNISEDEIPAFTAVAISGEYVSGDPQAHFGRLDGVITAAGVPAVNAELPWGIAREKVAPGEFGTMIVAGVTPALFSGEGRRVTPAENGLTAGESGNGEVIFPAAEFDGETFPGLLILGSAPAAATAVSNDYSGIFKLQALSGNSVAVVLGSNPDHLYCGSTDVPGLNNILRTELVFTEKGLKNIYLLFFYDRETKKYSCRFDTFIPADAVFYLHLGSFSNGYTVQSFRSYDDRAVFGNNWYLV